ncbi:MAG TPA: teicoplanin resistance protein VanZ [Bacteroidetes bacterium]|nr:teicoplanin resistance protein VanZ [Bacteroidota bacterium]
MIQLLKRHGFTSDQLPAILWAVLIFVASSIPSITLPELKFIPADKAVHLIVYFVFCALAFRALSYQKRFPRIASRALTGALLLSVLFGLSDEFHQSFVPNRVADVLDVVADSLGALLFLAYELAGRRRSAPTNKPV